MRNVFLLLILIIIASSCGSNEGQRGLANAFSAGILTTGSDSESELIELEHPNKTKILTDKEASVISSQLKKQLSLESEYKDWRELTKKGELRVCNFSENQARVALSYKDNNSQLKTISNDTYIINANDCKNLKLPQNYSNSRFNYRVMNLENGKLLHGSNRLVAKVSTGNLCYKFQAFHEKARSCFFFKEEYFSYDTQYDFANSKASFNIYGDKQTALKRSTSEVLLYKGIALESFKDEAGKNIIDLNNFIYNKDLQSLNKVLTNILITQETCTDLTQLKLSYNEILKLKLYLAVNGQKDAQSFVINSVLYNEKLSNRENITFSVNGENKWAWLEFFETQDNPLAIAKLAQRKKSFKEKNMDFEKAYTLLKGSGKNIDKSLEMFLAWEIIKYYNVCDYRNISKQKYWSLKKKNYEKHNALEFSKLVESDCGNITDMRNCSITLRPRMCDRD